MSKVCAKQFFKQRSILFARHAAPRVTTAACNDVHNILCSAIVLPPSVRANRPGLFREIVFIPTLLRRISSNSNVKSTIVVETIKFV